LAYMEQERTTARFVIISKVISHILPCEVSQLTLLEMVILVISKAGHVEEKKYTKRDNPEEMKALSVNLGALGFVYPHFHTSIY
jgi:hypothetical protein